MLCVACCDSEQVNDTTITLKGLMVGGVGGVGEKRGQSIKVPRKAERPKL